MPRARPPAGRILIYNYTDPGCEARYGQGSRGFLSAVPPERDGFPQRLSP